jgi:hypothetical protein
LIGAGLDLIASISAAEETMADESEVKTSVLAETSNFVAWISEEPDGESTYHLELGTVTLHFFKEEWVEMLDLMRSLI